MTYTIKINGETVTPEEAERRLKKKQETFLIDPDEWLRHPPAIITDDTEFQTHKAGWGPDELPATYTRELIAAGGSPHGKRYFKSLARYPGDPRAWVSSRGEQKKIAAERGMELERNVAIGGVKRNRDCIDPGPIKKLADDVIDETVQEMIAQNPDLRKRPVNELRHEVREKHGAHWGEDDDEFNKKAR